MNFVQSPEDIAAQKETTGFMDWLKNLLRKFTGGVPVNSSHKSASVTAPANSDKTLTTQSDEEGAFVLAPGGYRIRLTAAGEATSPVGEALPNVRDALAAVPPLPTVVNALIQEVQRSSSSAGSVAKIAANDPAIAASLLRTVNSSAFGLLRKITSVSEAVNYLGFSTVKSIVLRLQFDQIMPRNNPASAAIAQDLWVHSLAVSYVAECLAERVDLVDRGLASTLGLLHDIGKLAIVARLNGQAAQPGRANESSDLREARVYGLDHAGIGANLAHHWKLPADLVKAIRWHHHPDKAFEVNDPIASRNAVYLVQVANELAKYAFPYAGDMELDPSADQACEKLGLGNSVARLMDSKVRAAITRAIFYTAEGAQPTALSARPFLFLRKGDEARQLAASAQTADRIRVDSEGLSELFAAPGASFDLEATQGAPSAKTIGANSPVKFKARATLAGVNKLILAVAAHQEAMQIPGPKAASLAYTLRALLANLVEANNSQTTIEVAQTDKGIAVRANSLGFVNRLGADQAAGAKLVEAELGAILNLEWFTAISTSPDGTTLMFETE